VNSSVINCPNTCDQDCSCFILQKPGDKHWPDVSLGLYADFTFFLLLVMYNFFMQHQHIVKKAVNKNEKIINQGCFFLQNLFAECRSG